MYKYFFLLIEFMIVTFLYYESFHYNLDKQFSFYGIILILYLYFQLQFSFLNHRKNLKLKDINQYQTVLLLVGHQEKRDYWKNCLLSVKNLVNHNNLIRIYIVIDGDTPQDYYMRQMAETILSTEDSDYIDTHIYQIPKRGKRGAMYFGLIQINRDYYSTRETIDVIVSDSDTVIDKKAPTHLQNCLRSNPKNGCATGTLSIFNNYDGILPKMINARYQYAFQIERASSSYMGCMTCCSGPISIYRLDLLNELILQKFISQSYLNVKCEPGDDRHLTNMILALGYHARQTNLAVAYTEAPETLFRFLKQQLRWARSFYREMYWQLKAIPKQSHYLCFITIYEFLFPIFVSIWIFYSLYFQPSLYSLIKNFLISSSILFIRTFILLGYSKNIQMLYNIIYYPVYLLLLLPTKLFALLTLINNQWETQSRNNLFIQCYNYISFHFIFILFWNVSLFFPLFKLCLY